MDDSSQRGPLALDAAGLIRRVGSLVVGDGANRVLRLGAIAILARTLGPSQFGTLNLALSLAVLIFTLGSLGLAEIGSRDVAAGTPNTPELIGRILLLRTMAVALLLSVAAVVFAAAGWPAIVLVEVGAMSIAMTWNGDWLARALDKVGILAAAITAGGAVCVAGAGLAHGSSRVQIVLAAFVAGEWATALLLWWGGLRSVPVRFGIRGLSRLLRQTPAVATSVVVVYGFYTGVDYFLIAALRSSAAAGLYSAPYRLFMFTLNLATFAAYVLLPRLAAGRSERAFRISLLHEASRALGAYGLVVLGATLLLARPVLLLLFGVGFAGATGIDTLYDLGIAGVVYATAYPLGYVSLIDGSGRTFMRGAVVTAAANVVLDVVLLPVMGIEGAAVATVAALSLGSIWWTAWLPRAFLLRRVGIPLAVALAAVLTSRADGSLAPVAGAVLIAGPVAVMGATWRRRHVGHPKEALA